MRDLPVTADKHNSKVQKRERCEINKVREATRKAWPWRHSPLKNFVGGGAKLVSPDSQEISISSQYRIRNAFSRTQKPA